MPRYFFDLKDGRRLVDPTGLDCHDDEAALSKARLIAVEAAAGLPDTSSQRYVVVILDGQEVGRVPVEPSITAK